MVTDVRPRALAIAGPTASGKTAFALACAAQYDGEIVSVDSALVYRGLDIGAAKPTLEERAGIPHHLIDVRDPWEAYSAADFARDARAAIADIVARGKTPILAGGTGLYFQALLHGLAPMPEADPRLRAEIAQEAAVLGWPALHAQLAEIDPVAAKRIHATDPQRIQRALEVFRASGRTISDWQRAHDSDRLPVNVLKLALAPSDRAVLHARIEARFDAMLEAGFLDEVRRLRAMPQLQSHPAPRDLPAVRAVGYRQAWEFLEGEGDASTFRERGIAATRQLAKRQWTWLRGELDMLWCDPGREARRMDALVAGFLG